MDDMTGTWRLEAPTHTSSFVCFVCKEVIRTGCLIVFLYCLWFKCFLFYGCGIKFAWILSDNSLCHVIIIQKVL